MMPKIKAVVINSAKGRNDNFNVIALINFRALASFGYPTPLLQPPPPPTHTKFMNFRGLSRYHKYGKHILFQR